jgi:hypothetical protein
MPPTREEIKAKKEIKKQFKLSAQFALMMLPRRMKNGKEWTQESLMDAVIDIMGEDFAEKTILKALEANDAEWRERIESLENPYDIDSSSTFYEGFEKCRFFLTNDTEK